MGVLIHTWAAPLLALILVSPAAAQRVAVLARVAPAPAADAFTADLEAALLTHGLRPIDPAQSRAMRSVNDAGQIMAEGLSALTVPLDADYLLVAVGDAQPLPDEFGGGAFRALGAVRLKLITVATGEVVATASHEGATQHFTQVSALGRALSASGRAAAQALLRQRADRPTHPLTLVLEGCDPVARCQAALATLGRQPDVAGVEVVQLAPTASKVEVRLVGGGGAALVARLGLVPDLAPVAFTHDTVRARLTPPPPPPPKARRVSSWQALRRAAPRAEGQRSVLALAAGVGSYGDGRTTQAEHAVAAVVGALRARGLVARRLLGPAVTSAGLDAALAGMTGREAVLVYVALGCRGRDRVARIDGFDGPLPAEAPAGWIGRIPAAHAMVLLDTRCEGSGRTAGRAGAALADGLSGAADANGDGWMTAAELGAWLDAHGGQGVRRWLKGDLALPVGAR